ncbi:hypothetical protein SAMN05216228_104632 [Rhizobium tibeticum]|uniref:Uncharacterized protein n=1 Tax=Rhizobium tibeticum TaxID=501024 RepID=A0A1H8VS15_9HYPH|nr:hypothetical protein RTCCBAU85039_6151 [Rhizobium tibeticum]SEP18080.1 hypothetical protein SAMN05216228_104632 [Rhizobium tibeticum]
MKQLATNEDCAIVATAGDIPNSQTIPNGNASSADTADARPIDDFSFIKNALKAVCRENGVTRDRKATLEIAALLVALVKEGVHDEEQLVKRACQRWEAAKSAASLTASNDTINAGDA